MLKFAIDRGGTFCDVYAETPGFGNGHVVIKLLSVDPANYNDAPTEGIRRVLEMVKGEGTAPKGKPLPSKYIESIRMGTTVATNALLERRGARSILVTTKGLGDALAIGTQARPNIFDLKIEKRDILYERVIEVAERVKILTRAATSAAAAADAATDDGAAAARKTRRAAKRRKVAAEAKEKPKWPADVNEKHLFEGSTGESVEVLSAPDASIVKPQLQRAYEDGIRSVAIAFAHAYAYSAHEEIVAKWCEEIGFTNISLSHQVVAMVKFVPRGQTACVDAYLTPLITEYLNTFKSGFDDEFERIDCSFMMSDGGLCPIDEFNGHRSILSGPAGGYVGYARTAFDETERTPVIAIDMGGTSSDVSRYAGSYEHVFETQISGVSIMSPQLDIHTVAAGGGSRLFYRNGLFVVGPESAGAHPGPVCYRKEGGLLAVTDANVVLGRVQARYFPAIFGQSQREPLDVDASRRAFESLLQQIAEDSGNTSLSVDEVASGFIRVAVEAMCRPIRNITEARGHTVATHTLSCFGGAGPQHACAMAATLGMRKVHIHRHAGILSAFGMGLADVVYEDSSPFGGAPLDSTSDTWQRTQARLRAMADAQCERLRARRFGDDAIRTQYYYNLRFAGADTTLMVEAKAASDGDNAEAVIARFEAEYEREFGFLVRGRAVCVDDVRVRVAGESETNRAQQSRGGAAAAFDAAAACALRADSEQSVYFEGSGRISTPVYLLSSLENGKCARLKGPALLMVDTATVVIEPAWIALIDAGGSITLLREDDDEAATNDATSVHDAEEAKARRAAARAERRAAELRALARTCDPILLSVFGHRFMSIAEMCGRTLQRTSMSVNIKERLDFSCAIFGPDGSLVANAPHLPVHLGAMQEAVRWQIEHLGDTWQRGEVLLSNHPCAGGSHLPDLTVITPVYTLGDGNDSSEKPIFYVASRGHHADVGGATPGSMPPFSRSLSEEGVAIKSFRLVKNGRFQESGVRKLFSKSRCLQDNLSDLRAQVAANQRGIALINALVDEYSLQVVQAYMHFIQQTAEKAVRNMLRTISSKRKTTNLKACDEMDDGTPISLNVKIDVEKGSALFDFSGTGVEMLGNCNAPEAVTKSAIIYALRCMVSEDIPLNQGCMNPITIRIPKNSLLSPSESAAVVGGNVLTSQRVTDVIFEAFGACANSQGCMNNFTFGDNVSSYYETIGGGAGAGPSWDGASGVQVHMTNTRITDVEVLERRHRVLVREFAYRKGSGGSGAHCGGDGLIREIEFLAPKTTVSVLSERRCMSPRGIQGGSNARRGANFLLLRTNEDDGNVDASDECNAGNEESGFRRVYLGGKNTYELRSGECVRIETPGGGGYGALC